MRRARSGARPGIVARKDTTVEDAMRAVLDSPPAEWRSHLTMKAYRAHAEHIFTAIGKTKLARLTASQVDGMLRDMAREGASKSTISRTRSLLMRAIRRAERGGSSVSRNMAALSEMPAAPERASKTMTLEQVGALLALDLTPW